MAQSKSLILRLISSCIPIANQAGKIIRDVMKKGELNIVHKVLFSSILFMDCLRLCSII